MAGPPVLGWNEGCSVLGLLLGLTVLPLLLLLGFCPGHPRPVVSVAVPLDRGLQLPASKRWRDWLAGG